MIVQTFMVILILSVALICDVTGSSYSNVYVESEVVPIGYYSYGTPYPSIANPRLSQINSLSSVPEYVGPCVSPCVYPAQTVATVNPINPSPNVLTYNAPSVPIVVAPTKQEATGYEFSYVVYDENTGDHKAQRELSDGSVVRGEYSFLQPDGYVRQVQYVADDISGFNAVVKQFLPAAVEGQRKVAGQENKESSPPCHEIKNESLKEGSQKLNNKHSNEESAEKSKDRHGTSKETVEQENSKESKKVFKEESGEESEAESNENQSKKPKTSKEASGEQSAEKSKEKSRIKPKHSKEEFGEESEEKSIIKNNKSKKVSNEDSGEQSEENSKEKTVLKKSKESTGESKEKQNKKAKKESKESGEESEEESKFEESKEELKEKSGKKYSKGTENSREKNKNKSMKGSKEGSGEDSGEKSEEVGQGKHKEVQGLLKPNEEELVPYNDILRCIEAAMSRNYGVPAAVRQEPSPLTYIVLNKPC